MRLVWDTKDIGMELSNRADHSSGVPRRVSVKGREGVGVTVVVTVYHGHVWLSVVPPFTGEAIMEPRHVAQLIHALELARRESVWPGAITGTPATREGRVIQEIEEEPVTPEEKAQPNGTSVVRGSA